MDRAIHDWLDLAEEEAERRGLAFDRRPLTSKATFLIGDEIVVGKVRTSIAEERDHDRIWLEYDHERSFMERAHQDSRIITVALDITDPDDFSIDEDDFIIVSASEREKLPGGSKLPDKFYFYIGDRKEYYYNQNSIKKPLPTNSWDAVFKE
jgi:hypothetical protein